MPPTNQGNQDEEGTQRVRGQMVPYLRAWRVYRARSVVDLAQQAGVARSTIARAERGGLMAWDSIQAVAQVMRIEPHTLLHDAPPSAPGPPDTGATDPSSLGSAVEGWRQVVGRLAALAEGFDVESAADRAAVEAATEALARAWVRLRVALAALTGNLGE